MKAFKLVVALVALSAFTQAQASAEDITLIQSIPVETTLAQPDLPHAQDAWVKLFASARSSIDVGQFYLNNVADGPLEPSIRELEKAGARGVKIRVIADPGMVKNDLATYERFKKIPGLELRLYDLKKLTGGIIHAKYFVVDQKHIFVGSQNFDWKALSQIHETGVQVTNPAVARQLKAIFDIDWKICETGQAPAPTTPEEIADSAIELVASPPQFNPANVRAALPVLKNLFRSARTTIRAQVMSYNTTGKAGARWGEIDDELRAAARRGVKVELMVADWNTGKPMIDQLKELHKVPGVTVKIVSIPPLASGECLSFSRVMHSKLLVIDEKALWVGTSNWSKGYFEATRGVEMVFRMPEMAKRGDRIFEALWSSRYAKVLDLDANYQPPVKDCGKAL